MGAKVWSQIPAHIKDMPKTYFKSKIKSIMLESLNTNGYYPELKKICNYKYK